MQENVGDQWLRNSGSSTYPGEYDAICDAPLAKRNPACDQPIACGINDRFSNAKQEADQDDGGDCQRESDRNRSCEGCKNGPPYRAKS